MKKILFFLMAVLGFASCSNDQLSDLRLSGDCMIEQIAVDNYQGTVDLKSKTVTVRVPETFNPQLVTLTELVLSEGATSDVKQGDQLNLTTNKGIRVKNGDVILDWTLAVINDEARIYSFKLNDAYTGIINNETKTITVYVPASTNVKSLVANIVMSENATVSPLNGVPTDFTEPVAFTVKNNTAENTYIVTVVPIEKPAALFIGAAQNMDDLNPEEKAACQWMLANIPNSLYASFEDIKTNAVDYSETKIMWWHYHKDWGVDGKDRFIEAAPEALDAAPKLRDYYERGGAFFLTRYATNLPAFIGAVKNEGCPNNCWGGEEANPEITGGAWEFSAAGHLAHPLYDGLKMNPDNTNSIYTCDAGYGITNSTAQWHIGTDWGGYDSHDDWSAKTGAQDLGRGGDGAVVAWEFPATDGKGGIICIGSGCYDWYTTVAVPAGGYHDNVAKMTLNAFNYLMGK